MCKSAEQLYVSIRGVIVGPLYTKRSHGGFRWGFPQRKGELFIFNIIFNETSVIAMAELVFVIITILWL